MRKMRKGLSYVLVLALLVGSFSMVFATSSAAPAGVKLSDIEGILGQEEVEVCQNLGIITGNPDGTFLPDKDVNRAEFAAIITRTMGIPESALAGFSTTSFLDTSGYGWAVPYLAYCHSKGIMLGDGYGNAMPGRTITVNEAMTMICRALGYVENSALLTGSWPANYITLAQNLWLYDKLDRNVSLMTKEMSAIAIFNALMTQKVAVATDGKTDFQWVEKPNESAGRNGVIACFLNTGLECDWEWMLLGTGGAKSDNSLINVVDRIGAYGLAFFTKSKELVAFKMDSSYQLITGYIDGSNFIAEDGKKYSFNQSAEKMSGTNLDDDDINSGVMNYFNNGEPLRYSEMNTEMKKNLKNNWSDYSNSAKYLAALAEDWTDGEMLTLSGHVTGLTFRNVVAIVGWHADETAQIDSEDLRDIDEDGALLGYDFPTDYDSDVDERQISLVGVKSLDDLAADDIVYVYAYGGDGDIIRVAASNDTAEGNIDELNEDYVNIDGEEYSYAGDYLILSAGTTYSDISSEAGSDVIALLDAYGNVYDYEVTGGELGMYGVVTAWDDGNYFNNPAIKLVDREEEDLFEKVVGKKVKWNVIEDIFTKPEGKDYTFGSDSLLKAQMTDDFGASNVAAKDDVLIGYKLNSSNQFTNVKVGFAITGGAILNISSRTVARVSDSAGTGATTKNFTIDKNAAVFYIDGSGDVGTSTVANIDLDETKKITKGALLLSKDGKKVVAMIIPEKAANATSDTIYGAINTVAHASIDGDAFSNLTGIFAGESLTRISTKPDEPFAYSNLLKNVTLFEVKRDAAGKAKSVEPFDTYALYATGGAVEAKDVLLADSGAVNTGSYYLKAANGFFINYNPDEVAVIEVDRSGSGNHKYSKSNSVSAIRNGSIVWAYATDEDYPGVADIIIWEKP